jgi:dolichyl-phosphate beta-glucosyltransferase
VLPEGTTISTTPSSEADRPSRPGTRSLVIPMFDESGRIGVSLTALVASGLCDDRLEVVLVDDGSTDDTLEVVDAALTELSLAQARVVRLPANQGKGAAVRAGMLAASGASKVFVDADLSVAPEDIERCFATLEAGGADVVYGTRAHPGSALDRSQPSHRVVSGRTFNGLLRLLGLTSERDTQCGLKGFTAAATEVVIVPLVTDRFAFDVEALARAHRQGLRVEGLPVRWSHVEASRVRPLKDGVEMGRSAMSIRRRLAAEASGRVPPRGREPISAGTMAVEAIDAMAKVERQHWWFRAKHQLVLAELRRHGVAGPVVDVGAGTGGLLERLRRAGHTVIGVELDPVALHHAARLEPRPPLARAVAEAVPVGSASVGAATALDVIEHLDDDVVALVELGRLVGPSGVVLVAVPAYQWAWSDHDVRLGHRRRYQRSDLRRAAEAADLEVLRCTHFHSWLAPAAWLVRKTPVGRLLGGGSAEEASFGNAALNRVLQAVTDGERGLLRRLDLPVGLSILLVARPRGSAP